MNYLDKNTVIELSFAIKPGDCEMAIAKLAVYYSEKLSETLGEKPDRFLNYKGL